MNKKTIDFKKIKAGDVVKLKNGEIVLIEHIKTRPNLMAKTIDIAGYEVTTIKGALKDISIDDIVEVLSLFQKIWFIIQGWFKK